MLYISAMSNGFSGTVNPSDGTNTKVEGMGMSDLLERLKSVSWCIRFEMDHGTCTDQEFEEYLVEHTQVLKELRTRLAEYAKVREEFLALGYEEEDEDE